MKKKFSSGLTDIIAEHKGQMKKIWMLAVNDLIKNKRFGYGKRISEVHFYALGLYPMVFYKRGYCRRFTFDKTEQSVCYKTFISCVEYYDLLYTCVTDNTRRNVHNNVCDIVDSGVRAFDI